MSPQSSLTAAQTPPPDLRTEKNPRPQARGRSKRIASGSLITGGYCGGCPANPRRSLVEVVELEAAGEAPRTAVVEEVVGLLVVEDRPGAVGRVRVVADDRATREVLELLDRPEALLGVRPGSSRCSRRGRSAGRRWVRRRSGAECQRRHRTRRSGASPRGRRGRPPRGSEDSPMRTRQGFGGVVNHGQLGSLGAAIEQLSDLRAAGRRDRRAAAAAVRWEIVRGGSGSAMGLQ